VAGQDGSGPQRFGSARNPLPRFRCAEDVVRLSLCSFVFRVLFNRRHFWNPLKLEMRVTHGLAKSGQIAIHRRFARRRRFSVTRPPRVFQSLGLECLDVSFVDFVKREIRPWTITEQLAIVLLIKRDCAVLFGFGRGNPLVERCSELSQRRNTSGIFFTRGRLPLRFRFLTASGLANNPSPSGAR
jgi:hypothetical protein